MSHLDDLDEYEAELELALKREYQAVFALFRNHQRTFFNTETFAQSRRYNDCSSFSYSCRFHGRLPE